MGEWFLLDLVPGLAQIESLPLTIELMDGTHETTLEGLNVDHLGYLG